MSKVVTPGDDEVCFQCWDAKIRTSPKRKVNYKVCWRSLTFVFTVKIRVGLAAPISLSSSAFSAPGKFLLAIVVTNVMVIGFCGFGEQRNS